MSTFTWLDTSEADRRQALDVIYAFRERDTRDELGLGGIRDGLSDILFPGTTTIQTRARYFLFIPWIYRRLEDQRTSSARIARRARAAEIALIEPLAAETREGVIGIDARSRLKRLPSAVYWQGLGAWGIRLYPGSQDQYHRSLDVFYRRASDQRRDDDGELPDAREPNWDPALPDPPAGFPEEASLRVRPEERDYLRDRVVQRHPRSLLAHLIQGGPWDPVPFAWHHPEIARAPERNRHELHHARSFSELLHGAQLLYNLMLAQAFPSLERVEHYRERLGTWRATVELSWEERTRWIRFELHDLWRLLHGARVPARSREFVEAWLYLLARRGPTAIVEDPEARELIRRRETRLKRRLARLANRSALSMWGGAAGASQLEMRWSVTQVLLGDILSAGADA